MQRIVIIGTTGSGKSTLAKRLGKELSLSYIDLDEFNHLPGWQVRPPEEFRALIDKATQSDKWVVAGNYTSISKDISWPRADTLIWLDMPFLPNFFELLKRTIKRICNREIVCNGNRETFFKSFCSRESILWWLIQSWSKRKDFEAIFFDPGRFAHLKLIRLRSYRESREFVNRI